MKFARRGIRGVGGGRTPHGVRGLKLGESFDVDMGAVVAPLTGCVD